VGLGGLGKTYFDYMTSDVKYVDLRDVVFQIEGINYK